MIRVCHILSGDLWGGAEAQVFHLMTALAPHGHCASRAILFNDGITAEKLRAAKIETCVLPEESLSFPRLVSRCAAALDGASIAHCHGYKEDLVAAAATGFFGMKTILLRTQHGTPFPRTTGRIRFYAFLDRRTAAARFARTIAVSRQVRRELLRFLPEEKIALIPNGIPPVGPPCGDPPPFEKGDHDFVIGSVGRLAPEKRFDLLIDAVSLLIAEGRRPLLVLVGDGPERRRLEKHARAATPDSVLFAGFRTDVGRWLDRFDIYAVSSDREGLPISLLEAQLRSIPTAATSAGGIAEVILPGESGMLVPPGDARALAGALGALRDDPVRAARFGARGRAIVEERFTVDRSARATERLYEELAAGRSGAVV